MGAKQLGVTSFLSSDCRQKSLAKQGSFAVRSSHAPAAYTPSAIGVIVGIKVEQIIRIIPLTSPYMWRHWTTTILGLGLVVIAVVGLSGDVYAWAVGIIGTLVAIVGLLGTSTLVEK